MSRQIRKTTQNHPWELAKKTYSSSNATAPDPKEMETRSQGFSPPSWRQTGKYMASADHVIFNPEKLGVIIEHSIRGEEFRREFKQLTAIRAFSSRYQLQPWSSQQQHHHIYFKRLKDIYYTQIFWVLKITWSADARVFSRTVRNYTDELIKVELPP